MLFPPTRGVVHVYWRRVCFSSRGYIISGTTTVATTVAAGPIHTVMSGWVGVSTEHVQFFYCGICTRKGHRTSFCAVLVYRYLLWQCYCGLRTDDSISSVLYSY